MEARKIASRGCIWSMGHMNDTPELKIFLPKFLNIQMFYAMAQKLWEIPDPISDLYPINSRPRISYGILCLSDT